MLQGLVHCIEVFCSVLSGYKGDILCLQEVDRKVYMRDLSPAFDLIGYGGLFAEKDGEVS